MLFPVPSSIGADTVGVPDNDTVQLVAVNAAVDVLKETEWTVEFRLKMIVSGLPFQSGHGSPWIAPVPVLPPQLGGVHAIAVPPPTGMAYSVPDTVPTYMYWPLPLGVGEASMSPRLHSSWLATPPL